VNPQIAADLQELARREHRTLASYMEHILSVHAANTIPQKGEKPRKKGEKSAKSAEK
jgi:hypothetical protein